MNTNFRLIAFFGVHFLLTVVSPLSAETIKGKVVKVADGDTVTIVDHKGFRHRIRLAGIDAPEKNQSYGEESTKNLEWLVYNKGVTIEYSTYDRYGRIVGKIIVNSEGDTF